jgi:23S rRNA pseudouridine1911/1915/1917 synthase
MNLPSRRRKNRNRKPEAKKTERLAPLIRYADAQVVVVEKPAGLTTMRHPEEAAEFGAHGRHYLPATLADLLPHLLANFESAGSKAPKGRKRLKGKFNSPALPNSTSPHRLWIRAVHRLDKDTSGLVVFARTPEAERNLGRQFRAHSIERRYWAVVRGRAKPDKIESWLVRDRGDGRRGSAAERQDGQRAVTQVRILENLSDLTLVECWLETGRTHQVRIHLGEAGTPICGERIYDRPIHGRPFPDASHAPRLALHAVRLEFDHPKTGRRMTFTSPLPGDLGAWIKKLRKEGDG